MATTSSRMLIESSSCLKFIVLLYLIHCSSSRRPRNKELMSTAESFACLFADAFAIAQDKLYIHFTGCPCPFVPLVEELKRISRAGLKSHQIRPGFQNIRFFISTDFRLLSSHVVRPFAIRHIYKTVYRTPN